MEELIHIAAGKNILEGMLNIPAKAQGIVLFAHGSGSGRFSPRNNFVAKFLQQAGLGTILIDLLTREEDEIYENRFNITLLKERLIAIKEWLKNQEETKNLKVGLFGGTSTWAAAALEVAAEKGKEIDAVVSRGGRPDLAIPVLSAVHSPTLFIVGGHDFGVIELNQEAFEHLKCIKKFEIVPGATHLFEEPGALDLVSVLFQLPQQHLRNDVRVIVQSRNTLLTRQMRTHNGLFVK